MVDRGTVDQRAVPALVGNEVVVVELFGWMRNPGGTEPYGRRSRNRTIPDGQRSRPWLPLGQSVKHHGLRGPLGVLAAVFRKLFWHHPDSHVCLTPCVFVC